MIIIGSGPSGYSAAIYAARAALRPLAFKGSATAGDKAGQRCPERTLK